LASLEQRGPRAACFGINVNVIWLAGIYLHIPFCRHACNYCNFHFSTSLRYKNELLGALLKELELFKATPPAPGIDASAGIETIYIGGGTPSLLTVEEIGQLLFKIRQEYRVTADAEITLEANPDDITEELLIGWKANGITRLSIGVQSFFEEDLAWMNRAHNAVQAREALMLALRYFPNITMDLIYGTPGLTHDKWKSNVQQAVALGVPHLSCYALTVEPQTPLQKMISQHKLEDVNPDMQSEQFMLLMDWMEKAGYQHYEISNYAKPGYRSRHNSAYWQGKPYYGFGPSAHSFDGASRWWNIANNQVYINSIGDGRIPFEREQLTPVQRFNEYVMIGLRTNEGLSLERLRANEFGLPDELLKAALDEVLSKSKAYGILGNMNHDAARVWLNREGKLLADGIAADLFLEEPGKR